MEGQGGRHIRAVVVSAPHHETALALGQILHRRHQLHLSQQALAVAAGVPQAEISRIERGLSNPTVTTIGKIVSALGSARIRFDWDATAKTA